MKANKHKKDIDLNKIPNNNVSPYIKLLICNQGKTKIIHAKEND